MSAGNQFSTDENVPLTQKDQTKVSYTTPAPIDTNAATIKRQITLREKRPKLNLFNKLSLTYINVMVYNQRRALYPFAIFFSNYYSMSNSRFAWIISAFHLGGFLAIFVSAYMVHFRFNRFLVIMLSILSITNILMVIWKSFAGLLLLRIIGGWISTLIWSEVTGSIGAFTEQGAERTTGIIVTESSFTITSLFFLVIGVILKELNVTWFWIILALMGMIGSFLAFLLPRISLFEASKGNVVKLKRIRSVSTLSLVPITPQRHEIEKDETEEFVDFDEDELSDLGEEEEINDFPERDKEINVSSDQRSPDLSATRSISSSSKKKEKYDKFSFTACFNAYSNLYHLMAHFFLLFLVSAQFPAFTVTFGGWLVDTYNINAVQLGYFTLANTIGGVTALIMAPIISKYKANLFGIIIGVLGVAFFALMISILVWSKTDYFIPIFICFYGNWVFSQLMFLNIIVCNLDFSPKGYESTTSLIFQMIARGASFVGTVVGPYIVELWSFPILVNISCILFIITALLYIAMYRFLYKSEKYRYLTQVKPTTSPKK